MPYLGKGVCVLVQGSQTKLPQDRQLCLSRASCALDLQVDALVKLLAHQEHVLEDAKPAQAGRGDGALRTFRTSSIAARG